MSIAVMLIWGSVLALSGRSRVLLIVAASLVAGLGLIGFLGSLKDPSTDGGGIVSQLIGLVMAGLIIVLLSRTAESWTGSAVFRRSPRPASALTLPG